MRRSGYSSLLVVLLLLVGSPAPGAAGEEEEAFADPIRVLLYGQEVGPNRIWDGIKKGLEFANLPRAGTDDLGKGPEGVIAALEAKKPPLLFVVGHRAARVLGDRLGDVPRVYVYTAWSVNGEAFPPPFVPKAPARVLRQVTYAVKVAEVLRGLWPPPPPDAPGRRKRYQPPKAMLSWAPKTEEQRRVAEALQPAAGFKLAKTDEEADLILHLGLGLGEEPAPIDELVARAKKHRIPLISDDLAHWPHKASILVIPNHNLLGRLAAEEGRILYDGESAQEPEDAGLTEVWVDLDAWYASDLQPSVRWLASVDRLRRGPRRPR
jgi:hypothetical protein